MTYVVRIGVSGPFTGPRAAYGDLLREAAQESQIQADMIFADDMAQVPQAERVANDFVVQGVDAVVGHFNSDCARAAGPIYRDAGIPFLMPAATAPDLIEATGGYRICAPDGAQVDALGQWLIARDQKLAEVWQDGSPYATRLADLLKHRDLVDVRKCGQDGPIAFLGAHHAVAREINHRGTFDRPVFVPDDCAIAEFDALIGDVDVTLLCAVASPRYSTCVRQAFHILSRSLNLPLPLADVLANDPIFVKNQHRLARFELSETTRATRNFQGGQS